MFEPYSCPLCKTPGQSQLVDARNIRQMSCKACGNFEITTTVEKYIHDLPPGELAQLSDATRAAPEGLSLRIQMLVGINPSRPLRRQDLRAEYTKPSC